MPHTAKTLNVALYCRVSTQDQSCERQVRELKDFAARAGYSVVKIFVETASGVSVTRAERAKVMKLAQARKIDAVLVTEMTRWGRSLQDLIDTLHQLNAWGVSLIAENGMTFDLNTPQGKMLAGVLGSLAEFERDMIAERVKSGLANARAKGKKLGRQHGQCPADKHASKVLAFREQGKSIRWIADELHISTTTVQGIMKRHAFVGSEYA